MLLPCACKHLTVSIVVRIGALGPCPCGAFASGISAIAHTHTCARHGNFLSAPLRKGQIEDFHTQLCMGTALLGVKPLGVPLRWADTFLKANAESIDPMVGILRAHVEDIKAAIKLSSLNSKKEPENCGGLLVQLNEYGDDFPSELKSYVLDRKLNEYTTANDIQGFMTCIVPWRIGGSSAPGSFKPASPLLVDLDGSVAEKAATGPR